MAYIPADPQDWVLNNPTLLQTEEQPKAKLPDADALGLGPPTPKGQPLPVTTAKPSAADLGLGAPGAVPPGVIATPPGPPQKNDFIGSLAATLNAMPRGLFGGKTVDAIEAATQTPQRMLYGDVPGPQQQGIYGPQQPQGFRLAGPGQAFNEAQQRQQQMNKTLSEGYPLASLGGEMTGGLLGGAMAAPALGWAKAAGVLPRLAEGASYLGRNAGFGGAMSYLNGGDFGTGAGIGAVMPAAHIAGSALINTPLQWGARQLPQLFSRDAQASAVGRTLAERMSGSPIQTSPVGPLSLAQATDNPVIAAYGDVAPSFNPTAHARLMQDQQDALNQQVARIGGPPRTAPDAANRLSTSLRAADDMIDNHEDMLWNVPQLSQQLVPTSAIKVALQGAIDQIPSGLRLGVTGPIREAVNLLDSMPRYETVGNLNSVRTAIRLASRPSERNPWASAVGSDLQQALTGVMDRTLSAPSIAPDIRTAWQDARDFTREARTGPLSTRPMATAISPEHGASTASRSLFNFSFGDPDGPNSLVDLARFMQLRVPGGGGLSSDIIDGARSYLAAGMRNAGRLDPGQNFNAKTLQDFIRTNSPWMQNSGILTAQQRTALTNLSDYTDMLRRPDNLLRFVSSPTMLRANPKDTFIDEIMNARGRWLAEIATTLGVGLGHSGVGGLIAGSASAAFEAATMRAETAMRGMMAEALQDPRVAQDFMRRASPGNWQLLSPKTRQIIDTARAAIGSDVLPQLSAQPAAPPTGAQ
jgi:hypothetical protein